MPKTIDNAKLEYFDSSSEKPITIASAAVHYSRSESTIRDWITRGKHGIRLECLPAVGGYLTSHESVRRFFQRLAERKSGRTNSPARKTRTESQAAHKALQDAGWVAKPTAETNAKG